MPKTLSVLKVSARSLGFGTSSDVKRSTSVILDQLLPTKEVVVLHFPPEFGLQCQPFLFDPYMCYWEIKITVIES